MFGSLRSGAALLALNIISKWQFDAMPRDTKERGKRAKARSKYRPHQGKQECARRVHQIQAGKLSLT